MLNLDDNYGESRTQFDKYCQVGYVKKIQKLEEFFENGIPSLD